MNVNGGGVTEHEAAWQQLRQSPYYVFFVIYLPSLLFNSDLNKGRWLVRRGFKDSSSFWSTYSVEHGCEYQYCSISQDGYDVWANPINQVGEKAMVELDEMPDEEFMPALRAIIFDYSTYAQCLTRRHSDLSPITEINGLMQAVYQEINEALRKLEKLQQAKLTKPNVDKFNMIKQ